MTKLKRHVAHLSALSLAAELDLDLSDSSNRLEREDGAVGATATLSHVPVPAHTSAYSLIPLLNI